LARATKSTNDFVSNIQNIMGTAKRLYLAMIARRRENDTTGSLQWLCEECADSFGVLAQNYIAGFANDALTKLRFALTV